MFLLDAIVETDLIRAGGMVLVIIVMLATFMWWLILDRYLYHWISVRAQVADIVDRWTQRGAMATVFEERLKRSLVDRFRSDALAWTPTISVITAILPMLGLLGTVIGMIKIFEVMTVFGSGNVRGMAEGISQALVTTMAGLITALSGVYFAGDLEARARRQAEALSTKLGELP